MFYFYRKAFGRGRRVFEGRPSAADKSKDDSNSDGAQRPTEYELVNGDIKTTSLDGYFEIDNNSW